MKTKTRRRSYLLEAGMMLLLARGAVRFLPRSWVLVWASWPPRRIQRFALHEIGWVSWALETVGAPRRMNAPSLPRALATQAMLRRRGIVSKLCLGVATESGALAAHAWVEAGDEIVGAAATDGLTPIAAFGGVPS